MQCYVVDSHVKPGQGNIKVINTQIYLKEMATHVASVELNVTIVISDVRKLHCSHCRDKNCDINNRKKSIGLQSFFK